MGRNLDLDVLRAFELVVREGSFARAAEKLCLSAPAVSLQMKRLEDSVGGDVFFKDGRGKVVTERGQRLLEFARRMLHLNDLALGEFCQDDFKGRVRLGAAQDFAEDALVMLLREIQSAHQKVQIDLVVDLNRRIHAAFERDELDVAIATADPNRDLLGERLMETDLIWIGARDLTLRRGEPLPLILFPEPCIVREIVLATLAARGITWRAACVSTSLEGLLTATRAGLGLTVRSHQNLSRDLIRLPTSTSLPALPKVSVEMRLNSNSPSPAALVAHVAKLAQNVVVARAARPARPVVAVPQSAKHGTRVGALKCAV